MHAWWATGLNSSNSAPYGPTCMNRRPSAPIWRKKISNFPLISPLYDYSVGYFLYYSFNRMDHWVGHDVLKFEGILFIMYEGFIGIGDIIYLRAWNHLSTFSIPLQKSRLVFLEQNRHWSADQPSSKRDSTKYKGNCAKCLILCTFSFSVSLIFWLINYCLFYICIGAPKALRIYNFFKN